MSRTATYALLAAAALCLALAAALGYGVERGLGRAKDGAGGPKPLGERAFSPGLRARADFADARGRAVGVAHLEEGPNGVLIDFDLYGLPPGSHAVHIHETGLCLPAREEEGDADPPFAQAGGHLNPDGRPHGFMRDGGPHAGDLPNFFAGHDGRARFHAFSSRITLARDGGGAPARLPDGDGSAIIIHSGHDDYASPGTGGAGARIACAPVMPEE